jgi:hypothetical protein
VAGDRYSGLIPNDNIYVIATAADLPQQLDQWRIYHLLYDPGAGVGLYYSPDNITLVKIGSGGGAVLPVGTVDNSLIRWDTGLVQWLEFTAFILPTADGAVDQIMQTDGAGVVTWIDIPDSVAAGTILHATLRWDGAAWVESDRILNNPAADITIQANATTGFVNIDSPVMLGPHSGITGAVYAVDYEPVENYSVLHIGGGLNMSPVITFTHATFIWAAFDGSPTITSGVNPGFAAFTVLQSLPRLVAGPGAGNNPLAPLVLNAGPRVVNPFAGTRTTSGVTGVNFGGTVQTEISGAVMTVNAVTGMTASAKWSTVAGSTVNFGTFTGVDVLAPSAALFAPTAGIELMSAYYGIRVANPGINNGFGSMPCAAIWSGISAGTNRHFIQQAGSAHSSLASSHLYFDDNFGTVYGGTAGIGDFDSWISWHAAGGVNKHRLFFIANAASLYTSNPSAGRILMDINNGSTGELNINVAKASIGAQSGAIGNGFFQFIAPARTTTINGDWSDVLITAAGNLTVADTMGTVATQVFNAPSVTNGGGTIVTHAAVQIGGNPSGVAAVNRVGLDILSNPTGASSVNAALWVRTGQSVFGGGCLVQAAGTFIFEERAASTPPGLLRGEFWVRNDAITVPMFTDSAGADFVLNEKDQGIQGLGLWRYRTETGTPPASGQIRFDNANISVATEFYVSETNDGGFDVSAFMDILLVLGAIVYVQDKSNSDNAAIIECGTVVDSGTYRTVQIANILEEGTEPSQNQQIAFFVGGGGAGGGFLPLGTVPNSSLKWNGSSWVEETTILLNAGDVAATSFNSVPLTTAGVASNYLDETGAYSVPPDTLPPVASVFGRVGAVVALQADYDAFFLTQAEGDALYQPIGTYVNTFEGRSGAVVAIQADYDAFFLTQAEGDALYQPIGTYVTSITGGTNINITGTATVPIVNLDAAIVGVSVNAVTLSAVGAATNFLNEAGGYSVPAGSGGAVDSVTGGTNINVTGTAADPIVNLDAAIVGVSVNGVTLSAAGAATSYLNEAGGYSVPPDTGGQVDSVTGGTNINVSGTAVDPIVNLDAALVGVSVNGVTLDGTGAATSYLNQAGGYSVPPDTVGIGGAITNNQIAFGAVTANDIEGEAGLTWDGSVLFTDGNIEVQNIDPYYELRDTNASVDEKVYRWRASAGDLFLTGYDDSDVIDFNVFQIFRTAGVVTHIDIQAQTVDIVGNIELSQVAYIVERITALGNIGSQGQLWAGTDQSLNFTDSLGVNTILTAAGSVAAADITAGNLISTVLLFETAVATNSAFKIPFLNTTGNVSGNFGVQFDNGASSFTYNPSTNIFSVGSVVATTVGATLINGIALTTGGVATNYLDETGNYSVPAGAGGGIGGSITNNQVAVGAVTANDIEGNANLTWDGDQLVVGGEIRLGDNARMEFGDLANGDAFMRWTGSIMQCEVAATGNWSFESPLVVRSGFSQSWFDATNNDRVTFTNNGTDLVVTEVGMDAVRFSSINLRMGDADEVSWGNSDDVIMLWDNANLEFEINLLSGVGEFEIRHNGQQAFRTDGGGSTYLGDTGIYTMRTLQYNASGNTSGGQILGNGGNSHFIGYNDLFPFNDNVSDTLEASHGGTMALKDTSTARTLTLASNVDLDFPVNAMTTVVNAFTSGLYTVTEGASTTLYVLDGTTRVDSAGGITIDPGGVVNIWRRSATVYYCWGLGINP